MIHVKTRSQSLSAMQIAILLANNILGTSILLLPGSLSLAMDTPDGWLSILICGCLVIGCCYLLLWFSKRFPGMTLFECTELIMGRWIGKFINGILISYFIILCSYEMRILAEVVNLFLLERTPKSVIIIAMMAVSLYLLFAGLNAITRMLTFILPLTLFVLAICLALSLKVFDLNNLRPVLGKGFGPVLKGVKETFQSFLGIEALLILPAYLKQWKNAYHAAWVGVGIPTIVYFLTTVIVIGGLTLDGAKISAWPTISLIRSFEYTGVLVERYDSFLLTVWILQIFTVYVLYHFFMVEVLKTFLAQSKPTIWIFVSLPVIYILAMLPNHIDDVFSLLKYIYMLYYFMLLLPVLLMLVSFCRKDIRYGRTS